MSLRSVDSEALQALLPANSCGICSVVGDCCFSCLVYPPTLWQVSSLLNKVLFGLKSCAKTTV